MKVVKKMYNNDNIVVSVICLVYNHEKYLRKTLEGFLSQKTSFKYEVLIHDDCSTDNSVEIIKEYQKRRPDIIKPIFETENQYSKGVAISRNILAPLAQGRYLAWCEGDDFWFDENKLQKQVEFLDSNPEYSMCLHSVRSYNLIDKTVGYIPYLLDDKDYTLEDVLKRGVLFQTSSLVIRKEIYCSMPSCFYSRYFGDYQIYMYGTMNGKCHVLKDIMSQYNYGVKDSWTDKVHKNKQYNIDSNKSMYELLEKIDEYYNKKYTDLIQTAKDRAEFNILYLSGDKVKLKQKKFKKLLFRQKLLIIREKNPWLAKIKRFFVKIGIWRT